MLTKKLNRIVITDPDICKRIDNEQLRRKHKTRAKTVVTLLIERLTQLDIEHKPTT